MGSCGCMVTVVDVDSSCGKTLINFLALPVEIRRQLNVIFVQHVATMRVGGWKVQEDDYCDCPGKVRWLQLGALGLCWRKINKILGHGKCINWGCNRQENKSFNFYAIAIGAIPFKHCMCTSSHPLLLPRFTIAIRI